MTSVVIYFAALVIGAAVGLVAGIATALLGFRFIQTRRPS